MRSTYGPERLLLASKKPRIIELIESIKSMSIDEIKLLPEKPDIIKGLINIKTGADRANAAQRAEAIADAMMAATSRNL